MCQNLTHPLFCAFRSRGAVMNALVLQGKSRCPKAKQAQFWRRTIACDSSSALQSAGWSRLGNMWDRDNGGDILEKLRRFWKNLPRFLENLPRFWRNVRDNFFFVGPFLEPFVEVFEREEMADGRWNVFVCEKCAFGCLSRARAHAHYKSFALFAFTTFTEISVINWYTMNKMMFSDKI